MSLALILETDFFSNVVRVITSDFMYFEKSLIIFFISLSSIKSVLFNTTNSFFFDI